MEVSVEKKIAAHVEVHQKGKQQVHKQVLLAGQDTTDLVYSGKQSASKFGHLLRKNT